MSGGVEERVPRGDSFGGSGTPAPPRGDAPTVATRGSVAGLGGGVISGGRFDATGVPNESRSDSEGCPRTGRVDCGIDGLPPGRPPFGVIGGRGGTRGDLEEDGGLPGIRNDVDAKEEGVGRVISRGTPGSPPDETPGIGSPGTTFSGGAEPSSLVPAGYLLEICGGTSPGGPILPSTFLSALSAPRRGTALSLFSSSRLRLSARESEDSVAGDGSGFFGGRGVGGPGGRLSVPGDRGGRGGRLPLPSPPDPWTGRFGGGSASGLMCLVGVSG